MVNFKAFATLVIVFVGIFIVVLSSLAANDQDEQFSSSSAGTERIAAVIDDSGDDPVAAELSTDHLPLMIRWSNWRPEFGPAYVYARERDLNGMLDLNAPVEKILMVTSIDEVQRLMRQSDQLKAAGVTTIGFNSENGTGMTPADEMSTLNSADPAVNVVARAAQLAAANDFEVMWGPVRRTVDTLSDDAIRTMIAAGVGGLAIQEQKFIESQDASIRLSAVPFVRYPFLELTNIWSRVIFPS